MTSRYAALSKNDIVNGEGICVSFWVQGCPHHCEGCFNPETWDFEGGKSLPADIKDQIAEAITDNGIERNFSVLGGEPLCEENRDLVDELITFVRARFPHIKIYLWTGYIAEDLFNSTDSVIKSILDRIDFLIDGPFIEKKRNLALKLRGSFNQRVFQNIEGNWKVLY